VTRTGSPGDKCDDINFVARRVSWRTESTLIAATASLFAEVARTGILVGTARGRRLHPSEYMPHRRPWGARRTRRRERVSPESQDLRSEGKPFARGSPVHVRSSSSPRPSSAQPSVGIPRAASQAERGGGGELRCSSPRQACPVRERCRWREVARSPPLLECRGYHASLAGSRGPAREARATQRRGWKHPPADAREDRTLEVVLARRRMSLQKSTAGVLAQRSGRLHFNRFGGVRGRAPSSCRPRESVNGQERRDIGAGSTRKQSRDRARDRPYPR